MAKKTPRPSPEAERTGREGHPVEAVIRKCQVCEWEGEVIEEPGADPDCPWCHGPTERTATLASSNDSAPGEKNPHAAALGRLGGLKGGRARAEKLSATQRRRIASRAARARWDKKKKEDADK
jgi:hypothetical protein